MYAASQIHTLNMYYIIRTVWIERTLAVTMAIVAAWHSILFTPCAYSFESGLWNMHIYHWKSNRWASVNFSSMTGYINAYLTANETESVRVSVLKNALVTEHSSILAFGIVMHIMEICKSNQVEYNNNRYFHLIVGSLVMAHNYVSNRQIFQYCRWRLNVWVFFPKIGWAGNDSVIIITNHTAGMCAVYE